MLVQRLLVAIVLMPVVAALVIAGGWLWAITAAAIFGYAAWEYWRIFRHGGYLPSVAVMVVGTAGLVLARHAYEFNGNDLLLSVAVLLAMTAQVIGYEKGGQSAAVDFNITLGGILYLGWLGAYYVSLRNLPDGQWWVLMVLPACWIGDGAAYFVGKKFGKHKMSPRVSPKKSWEGYIGGIIFGALGTMLLAMLWSTQAPTITPLKGFLLGLVVTVISPLGDLGESMLKRQFGIKDSGRILPGHGGMLDRIDSWLWAGVIGYYMITRIL